MATIAMVGDIFLQEALPQRADLAAVSALLQSADIAFGNLETPVSERGTPIDKWINMRMPPALLSGVVDMGFDIVTLANNHMWDFGEVAFFDTLRHLSEQGLPCVGAGADLDAAWRPEYIPVGAITVAFLGAASTLGPGSAAAAGRPGVAPIQVSESYHLDPPASLEQPGSAPYVFTRAWQEDVDRAAAAIEAARAEADFVVLALHWGVPPFWRPRFQDGLADYQIEVGHALIEAGADVIVGHHPHSLQAVEVHRGKPIFYSLGNFVFHHNRGPVHETPVSRNAPYSVNVDRRNREWSETVIALADLSDPGAARYSLQPALLDGDGNPRLLSGDEARAVIERLDALSPKAQIRYCDGFGSLGFS
ncbi:MAG: CapA family protein [Chloroflexota bacterium]|nr:CapA family protein [Chloroflexota bacterium]MDE2908621.1 CapA family protein [Chloroflexota bacterium]